MPSIIEILKEENENRQCIILHKEGLFYKAYEKSAFAWVKNICPFEVKCRNVKLAGKKVLSIGFPVKSLESRLNGYNYESVNERKVIVKLQKPINDKGYDEWRQMFMVSAVNENSNANESEEAHNDLLTEIIKFPLEISSPLECMMFLSDLKRRYHK